ncbi:rubrerythrin family protein [Clostridiaceae bacterium HSG29]|nr:rubrerythrin family protein [Clostridiaceae bacterium HSG29]
MKSIKGTETEKNLLKSFAGESQARMRYNYFASQAKKDGYRQIEAIFNETAENEKEHAKVFFKLLEGGETEIVATYPAGSILSTLENLKASANGELEEHSILYPEFANIADKEGFPKIASKFRMIAKVEIQHEKRFRKLVENIEKEEVFKKEEKVLWKCRNCGYVHEGSGAPKICPACNHPEEHFEIKESNY